jgi:hypothetical protein
VGGFCEDGNETLGFIKKAVIFDSFSNNILHYGVSKVGVGFVSKRSVSRPALQMLTSRGKG